VIAPADHSTQRPRPPGVIEPGQILTQEEALGRLGWGVTTLRRMKRSGRTGRPRLTPFRVGRRWYIASDDLLSLLQWHAQEAKRKAAGEQQSPGESHNTSVSAGSDTGGDTR